MHVGNRCWLDSPTFTVGNYAISGSLNSFILKKIIQKIMKMWRKSQNTPEPKGLEIRIFYFSAPEE